jgi:hypothetical protein
MNYRIDLVPATVGLAAALCACEPLEPAQVPVVEQHFHSTTNVYVTQVVTPAATPTSAPEVAPTRDACEEYIAKASACVRSITSDEAARARADEVLENLRRSAASENAARRTMALRACSRGLLGYVYAPCD